MVLWEDFSDGFDLNAFLRLTLTDKKPSESLLGIRY